MNDLFRERQKLYKEGIELQNLLFEEKNKNTDKTKQLQNKIYKKWKFYDEFIKAKEKEKHDRGKRI